MVGDFPNHFGVGIIRMSGDQIEQKINKVVQVLEEYLDQLSDSFTVITKDKVRIRKKE